MQKTARFGPAAAAAALIAGLGPTGCGGPQPITGTQEVHVQVPDQQPACDNPLLAEFDGPLGVPPFDRIRDGHYLPAFEAAMEAHRAEVEALAASAEPPTFANTVAALDAAGRALDRTSRVFFAKNSADTNDAIQAVAREIAPRLSAHRDAILMDGRLFARIKAVHDGREGAGLDAEQLRLVEETHQDFVRGGANLAPEDKQRLAAINERLALLGVRFRENLLAENNAFKLVIERTEDLSGLPESSVIAAAEAARQAGLEGEWVFTLHKPSWIPFLQFSDSRELRKRMFEAYANRGNNGDERDNKAILAEMAVLRIERAGLLGAPTHAHHVLEENMAREPAKVRELLDRLWAPALEVVKAEAAALSALKKKDKAGAEIRPFDWWYYTEKLRKRKFDLSDEELRPYFELSRVQQGAFEVARRLWGLEFAPRDDLPVYHEEARAFEVREADGRPLGVLYVDYHPRPGKGQGAWMTAYRGQERRDGERVAPVVANVFNFTRSTGGKPALLSLEEVETLFHEFGHGLHGLLSDVTWPGLAGTNVARDFVELPSQIMENWATEPEVLRLYARHFENGEPMPEALIEKIRKSQHFNQGFATTEYLAASYLDLAWHTLERDPGELDVARFEAEALKRIGLVPEVAPRYHSTYFAHIFAGGYSAGYYSYIWSAVLDSDAFAAFQEKGDLFHPATARAFREHVLSKGNSADPMELYVRFRGAEPRIEPLLKKRGLLR
jgi:peptidyl-dipeptidase Dcp